MRRGDGGTGHCFQNQQQRGAPGRHGRRPQGRWGHPAAPTRARCRAGGRGPGSALGTDTEGQKAAGRHLRASRKEHLARRAPPRQGWAGDGRRALWCPCFPWPEGSCATPSPQAKGREGRLLKPRGRAGAPGEGAAGPQPNGDQSGKDTEGARATLPPTSCDGALGEQKRH